MKMDDNFLRYSALDAACTLEAHNAFWADLDPIFRPAYDMKASGTIARLLGRARPRFQPRPTDGRGLG